MSLFQGLKMKRENKVSDYQSLNWFNLSLNQSLTVDKRNDLHVPKSKKLQSCINGWIETWRRDGETLHLTARGKSSLVIQASEFSLSPI